MFWIFPFGNAVRKAEENSFVQPKLNSGPKKKKQMTISTRAHLQRNLHLKLLRISFVSLEFPVGSYHKSLSLVLTTEPMYPLLLCLPAGVEIQA